MNRRLLFVMMVLAAVLVTCLSALPAGATTAGPTGERVNGGQNGHGGTTIEPVYDDMTGAIRYVSTPNGTAHPVPVNPHATAPFYLPVYPTSSSVATSFTLNCQDTTPAPLSTTENCPDHGPAVAGLAQAFEPGVYAAPGVAVAGHDHLMAGPGSHGDFNVAWVPTLVLFTNSAAANTHITSLEQINAMIASGDVITVPLDGSNGLPNLTFHCSVVSPAVYAHSVPVG